MNRERALETLRKQRFDVVVIGGGITGAGVALDAASRGLTVALVEKSDFASGTSSRSSKVIHGGLRYLKSLRFGVTIESVRERETLLRMAPDLVRPLPVLLPYDRSLRYKAALSIYDLMASSSRRHRRVEQGEMRRMAPYLRTDGVRGAFQYFDAAADDCRLVMHVLKRAVELGAVVANYVAVAGFTSEGVEVTDSIVNETFAVRGTTIVNATGVWSDTVRQKLDADSPRLLRASKGVHLVIDSAKLRLDAAVTIPKTSSGHYLFIAPWEGRTIIGTTDTAYHGNLDHPAATREDVALPLSAVD
ncbi:MAG: FAD-dependent oxidoreductase, partial [Thermoanaerobaculia bacterium]